MAATYTSEQIYYSDIVLGKIFFQSNILNKYSVRKKKYLNYHKKYLMFEVFEKVLEYFYSYTSQRLLAYY